MKFGIVGSGWYGSHLALELKKKGHDVTIYEKGPDIFGSISSKFGIRLHKGPHYPRSDKTRESCMRGFNEFCERYPDLVIPHEYSIYGLGETDSNNMPSHVDYVRFNAVCRETENCNEINPESRGYTHLISAWDIEEPSIALGERLRNKFRKYLSEADVNIKCNYEVKVLKKRDDKIAISHDGEFFEEGFDYIINATSYQAFIPDEKDIPFNFNVYYQPLLALVYEDIQSTEHPFSLIMMDGLFPCLMPYVDSTESDSDFYRKYILTHAKWTTLASCKTVIEANAILANLTNSFIEEKIKPCCESEMAKFWPEFSNRFKYLEWKGAVLAKLRTNSEFRSAVTFEKDGVIHIIPGKVSNIFDVEREVESLIANQNTLSEKGYRYVEGGVLHESMHEIREQSHVLDERNTCSQQTYQKLLQIDKNVLMFKSVSKRDNATLDLQAQYDKKNTNYSERNSKF